MKRTPILIQGRKRAYAGEMWLAKVNWYDKEATVVRFYKRGNERRFEEFGFTCSLKFFPEFKLIRRIDTSLPKKKGASRGKKA